MADRRIGVPDAAVLVVGVGVEAPTQRSRVEFVAQRCVIFADGHVWSVGAILGQRRNDVVGATLAAPIGAREVHLAVGVRGDGVLVRDEAAVEIRLEEVVRQDVLFGHLPIRLGLALRSVGVGKVRRLPTAGILVIPAVQPAVVVGREESVDGMVDVPIGRDRLRVQSYLVALGVVAVVLGRRAFEAHEEVVEAAVLLDDVDHVLDHATRGAVRGVHPRTAHETVGRERACGVRRHGFARAARTERQQYQEGSA